LVLKLPAHLTQHLANLGSLSNKLQAYLANNQLLDSHSLRLVASLANRVRPSLKEHLEALKHLLVSPERPAEGSLALKVPLNLPHRPGVSPQLHPLANLSPRAVVCLVNNQQTSLLADCLEQSLQTQLEDFLDSNPPQLLPVVDYLVNNPPLPKEVCLASNSPRDNSQLLPEAYSVNNLPYRVVCLVNNPNKTKQLLLLKLEAYLVRSLPKEAVFSEPNQPQHSLPEDCLDLNLLQRTTVEEVFLVPSQLPLVVFLEHSLHLNPKQLVGCLALSLSKAILKAVFLAKTQQHNPKVVYSVHSLYSQVVVYSVQQQHLRVVCSRLMDSSSSNFGVPQEQLRAKCTLNKTLLVATSSLKSRVPSRTSKKS
jgi:hypothetical protein